MLALIPAISVLGSVYGPVLHPIAVERQLAVRSEIMPSAAFSLIRRGASSGASDQRCTQFEPAGQSLVDPLYGDSR
jgi:hypothetical protein